MRLLFVVTIKNMFEQTFNISLKLYFFQLLSILLDTILCKVLLKLTNNILGSFLFAVYKIFRQLKNRMRSKLTQSYI